MTTATIRTLMDPDEVAAYLRVSPSTLRTWHARGTGPPAIKVGKFLRWRLDDVEAWLREQTAATDP